MELENDMRHPHCVQLPVFLATCNGKRGQFISQRRVGIYNRGLRAFKHITASDEGAKMSRSGACEVQKSAKNLFSTVPGQNELRTTAKQTWTKRNVTHVNKNVSS